MNNACVDQSRVTHERLLRCCILLHLPYQRQLQGFHMIQHVSGKRQASYCKIPQNSSSSLKMKGLWCLHCAFKDTLMCTALEMNPRINKSLEMGDAPLGLPWGRAALLHMQHLSKRVCRELINSSSPQQAAWLRRSLLYSAGLWSSRSKGTVGSSRRLGSAALTAPSCTGPWQIFIMEDHKGSVKNTTTSGDVTQSFSHPNNGEQKQKTQKPVGIEVPDNLCNYQITRLKPLHAPERSWKLMRDKFLYFAI